MLTTFSNTSRKSKSLNEQFSICNLRLNLQKLLLYNCKHIKLGVLKKYYTVDFNTNKVN